MDFGPVWNLGSGSHCGPALGSVKPTRAGIAFSSGFRFSQCQEGSTSPEAVAVLYSCLPSPSFPLRLRRTFQCPLAALGRLSVGLLCSLNTMNPEGVGTCGSEARLPGRSLLCTIHELAVPFREGCCFWVSSQETDDCFPRPVYMLHFESPPTLRLP